MIRWHCVSVVFLVAGIVPAAAQAPPCQEFPTNVYTTGYQVFPHVASAPNGDFVVVWESYEQDGSGTGIFGRRFDAAATALGPEFRVNTSTSGNQREPAAAVDAAGNFVVVWSGPLFQNQPGIFAQRFDASGARQGPEFQANTYMGPGQRYPAVAFDAAGNFVVVWQSYGQDSGSEGVFGRRFDATGIPLGPEFRVNSYTTSSQTRPSVSVRPTGEFVVVWDSFEQDGSSDGVFGQRFDATGAPVGGEFQINTYTTAPQRYARVAHGPNGDFVVVWSSGDADRFGIFGRRFDSSATAPAPEFQVNTFTPDHQYRPAIAGDPSRGYIVVWTSVGQDGDASGIFGRRLDPSGVPLCSELRINSYTASDQGQSAVARGANGGFVTAWDSYGQDGSGFGVVASLDCTRLYVLPPCRVADTRNPDGPSGGPPLAANTTRTFPVSGRCGVPVDARAVAFNITAANPNERGNLRVFPSGQAAPLASALNFAPAHTRANSAVVPLGAAGQVSVQCDMPAGSAGSTNLVLDVYGYFKR